MVAGMVGKGVFVMTANNKVCVLIRVIIVKTPTLVITAATVVLSWKCSVGLTPTV